MSARVRRVGTWQMTREELARVWAEHYGWTGQAGGWIYDDLGQPVVQGWSGLADVLERQGFIREGSGVMWTLTERRWRFLRPDVQDGRLARWRGMSRDERARQVSRARRLRREMGRAYLPAA